MEGTEEVEVLNTFVSVLTAKTAPLGSQTMEDKRKRLWIERFISGQGGSGQRSSRQARCIQSYKP